LLNVGRKNNVGRKAEVDQRPLQIVLAQIKAVYLRLLRKGTMLLLLGNLNVCRRAT
jgi:hypothetical protein